MKTATHGFMQSQLPFQTSNWMPAAEEKEFWTAAQRAGNPLHEVPYRACFKPQLAEFFIREYSQRGDVVLDPFMGRGTTLLEAALNGRIPWGNDANPLSAMLIRPRLNPPNLEAIQIRLAEIPWSSSQKADSDLLAFYHPKTLEQLQALQQHLARENFDSVDDWIRMVALTRLSGHSTHFFSVYTLPPNQAVTPERQRKINQKLKQQPEIRDVKTIILRKSKALLRGMTTVSRGTLKKAGEKYQISSGPADQLSGFASQNVQLVVTSPPFLNEVQYGADNWLRGWFAELAPNNPNISEHRSLGAWQEMMTRCLQEWKRVLRPNGIAVVEVGEVRKGTLQLEFPLAQAAHEAGFTIERLMINRQCFSKTANCWGITNQVKGTNSNRILVLRKP